MSVFLNTSHLFSMKELYVFDQAAQTIENPIEPFAVTDVLINHVSQSATPMLHFWELQATVILGMKDTRVDHLAKGLAVLSQNNYHYLARNSGGLAVVADEGVLNFSLIVPTSAADPLSINEAYHLMTAVIQQAFQQFDGQIEAKEISDSYCPGEFDLSINGQKFAGIAQRRIKQGIAIMIYLSVTGSQDQRGQLLKSFYQTSLGVNFGKNGYPSVRPEAMANLSDLLGTDLTVAAAKKQLLAVFTHHFNSRLVPEELKSFFVTKQLTKPLEENLTKMKRRNEIVKQIGVE